MKKPFAILFILVILISACNPSNSITPSKSAPTSTEPVTTLQPALTSTSTPAPTATLALPVSQSTPVPSSDTKITAESIKDLQETARYYASDIQYIGSFTKDNKSFFIADGGGVDKYDYASMTKLVHIPIPITTNYWNDFKNRTEAYFQNTDDGNWVLINNRWLVDLRDNNQPKTRDLSAEIHLKNLYLRTASLSPDGSFLMVSDRKCSDACIWDVAKIINLSDGSKKDIPSLYGFSSAISPNGQYVAFATEIAVNIWRTTDFEKTTTLILDNPYSGASIAFSADGNLVAIAQKSNIKVYDVQTGAVKASVQGLCDNYQRRVRFAPNPPVRIVESSECDSGMWKITPVGAVQASTYGNLDLSRIMFDKAGNVSSIPYPYPASKFNTSGSHYYFQFLDNDTLTFKDDEYAAEPACLLSLSKGSIECSKEKDRLVDGQWLGTRRISGTDGQYYTYEVSSSEVKIRAQKDSSQVYYSLPWKGYIFSLEALDPVNKLIFYQIALDVNNNKEIIQDMETNRILTKFEGYTFFAPIAFSENKKYAAICRKISYSYRPSIDKLMVFDLTKKTVVYSTGFTCDTAGGALAFSNDGSKLAAEYVWSFSGNMSHMRVLLLDVANGFKRQQFDVETNQTSATAFTSDGNILALMCQDDMICFLDSSSLHEIHRLKTQPGITHIVFSQDGTLMATSSDWGLLTLWAVPPFRNAEKQ